jgi:hypothetical protein
MKTNDMKGKGMVHLEIELGCWNEIEQSAITYPLHFRPPIALIWIDEFMYIQLQQGLLAI